MPFQKLRFKPGIYKESTDYSAEGRWTDGNYIRFRDGYPEPIQGWEKATTTAFLGTCRNMHLWTTLSGVINISLGTHLKFYTFNGGVFIDITPIRSTGTLAASPFSVTNTSAVVTVTHTAHGAIANDFVTYASATAVGGMSAASLNTEHQITEIVDVNTYKFTNSETATSTTTGGGTPTFSYQINTGLDSTFYGSGWGAGSWGRGGWNSAADTSTEGQKLRLWSTWNYGEDIVFCPRDSFIYFWDSAGGSPGVRLDGIGGANSVPTIAKEVAVSSERHVIAFGCNPYGSSTQDTLLIRWSGAEDHLTWQPLPTNSSGDLRITIGSYFVTHAQTSQEILVWTDTALHSMRYVGAPFIYGIDAQAAKCSIIGPKAKAIANDAVYWMGNGRFFRYRGALEVLRCPLLEHVFNNFNQSQRDKVFSGTNISWNEIFWLYPSASSNENDRYVVYNYVDDIWYHGTLARTAWLDRPDLSYPMATDPSGYLYYHDFGTTDGSASPVVAIPAFIESSFFELGNGDSYSYVDKFIPDVTFRGSSEATQPILIVTLTASDWPGAANSTDGTFTGNVTRSSTFSAAVETYTNYINMRLRGRMMKVKYSNTATDMSWRIGTPRINIRPDGRQ